MDQVLSNNPPPLRDILDENYARILAEVEALARRADEAPKKVGGIDDLGAVGAVVRDAKDLWNRTDLARKMEKEPHLKASREVDGFFSPMLHRVVRIEEVLTARASEYQRRVRDEARRTAEAVAAAARQEEARRLDAARKAEEDNRAKHAEQHAAKANEARAAAEQAEAVAAAPAKDVVRAVTDSGITAGGKSEWTFRNVDFAKVNLELLRPYVKRDAIEAALRLAIKQGVREIDGAEIYENLTATFR